MNRRGLRFVVMAAVWLIVMFGAVQGQQPQQTQIPPSPPIDLAKEPTLFVVPYAHLDTEWRWDYPTTIREIPAEDPP